MKQSQTENTASHSQGDDTIQYNFIYIAPEHNKHLQVFSSFIL